MVENGRILNHHMSRRRLFGAAGAAVAGAFIGTEAHKTTISTASTEIEAKKNVQEYPFSVRLPEIVSNNDHVTLAEENAKPGSEAWKLTNPDVLKTPAFTSSNSVFQGEKLDIHVANDTGRANIKILRLGWYGGTGGRLVYDTGDIACPQVTTEFDPETRTLSGSWESAHALKIPDNWRSGVYVVVATGKDGSQSLSPFWVRSHDVTAPILVGSGLLTFAAYNFWAPNRLERFSLYDWRKDMPNNMQRASKVSLDRPLRMNGGTGELFVWDLPFIRWLERSGFDADYYADVDSHNESEIFKNRKLVVMVGHHEYYTNEMRQRLDDAVNKDGANLLLLGSNACYWRVRLGDSKLGKNRTITCYKDALLDPEKELDKRTIKFRDSGNPETLLFGIAYEQTNPQGDDWIVANEGHWLFNKTGLKNGDRIPKLVGREYDSILPQYPIEGERTILAASQVNTWREPSAQGTSYTVITKKPSGADVVAFGTLDWTKGLDAYRPSELKPQFYVPPSSITEQIMRNALEYLT